jgi:1-acyl-sn-glycerol-3-phosphate acyltransferase
MLRQCPGVGNHRSFWVTAVMRSALRRNRPGVWRQIGGLDDNEMKPVGLMSFVASRVIDGSLLTSMDPAHC